MVKAPYSLSIKAKQVVVTVISFRYHVVKRVVFIVAVSVEGIRRGWITFSEIARNEIDRSRTVKGERERERE